MQADTAAMTGRRAYGAGMRARSMEVLAASAIAVCCAALAIHSTSRSPEPRPAPVATVAPETPLSEQRPRIEVVFVLDTTGSMGGLLEGAKQKIWAIANRLAGGEPRPELRVGLVAYRDRGDAYVTKRFDFTGDMDAVYAELLGYQAEGGGDFPEHVGQGLHDALTRMQWTRGDGVLRLVFLVGDAPPHDDEQGQDGTGTGELAARARAQGIVVNTIQCGSSPETARAWQRIAAATGGEFASIAQDGGVVAVETPYDRALWELNQELASTVLGWGSARDKEASQVKLGNRASMSVSAAAEAASYSAKTARMNAEDLIGAVDGGKALAEIPRAELPAEMQAMTPDEQADYLATVRTRREAVNQKIRAVAAERDAYLRAAERAAGADAGFDGKVVEALRRQASAVGVAY